MTLQDEHKKTILIKNFSTSKHLIIYTDNCVLIIYINGVSIVYNCGEFVSIERGVNFSFKMIKNNMNQPPCKILRLDYKELILLKTMFISCYPSKLKDTMLKRTNEDKIIKEQNNIEIRRLFEFIDKNKDPFIHVVVIAYMITKFSKMEKIINSLYISAATTFTDKVKCIINDDLSKKWRLSMIADQFHITEIAVRKRLAQEHTSFNNLLLELRMNTAMQMLHEDGDKIHQISKKIGISSTSYFIKHFKNYFGITPKQYLIYFRS